MVRASAMPRALSGRSRSGMPGEDQSDLAWRSSINRRMARSIDFVGAKVYSDVCRDICGLGAGLGAWYGAQLAPCAVADPAPRFWRGPWPWGLVGEDGVGGLMEGADQSDY